MLPLHALLLALVPALMAGLTVPEPAPQEPEEDPGRPGLVHIPGGKTWVGADYKETKERAQEDEVNRVLYVGELGRYKADVQGFWIAPYPVTNEMYLVYVNDTGAIPPPTWATISSELRQELIQAGKETQGPAYVFDEAEQARWWTQNWMNEGIEWEMPPSQALEPVVFVSYKDALKYCAWAGLRLPTEEEWVRAGRGDSENDYPFGKKWDATRVGCKLAKPSYLAYKRLPVGTLDNASEYGVYDLIGQVWEVVDTRYGKLEGDAKRVEIRDASSGRDLTLYPEYDPSRMVLKGGSFANEELICRLDARVGMDPDMPAAAMGFRVAASPNRVGDFADVRTRTLRSVLLGGEATAVVDLPRSVGFLRRDYPDMQVIRGQRQDPEAPLKRPELSEDYTVLGRVDGFAVTPLVNPFEEAGRASATKVNKLAINEGRYPAMATLTTTTSFTMAELRPGQEAPTIPPGEYVLIYFPPHRDSDLKELGGWKVGQEAPYTEDVERRPNIDITGIQVEVDTPYILVVGNKAEALMALPLTNTNNKLQFLGDAKLNNKATLNLAREYMQFEVKVPAGGGKACGFEIRLKPVDAEGAHLVKESAWDKGDYDIIPGG